MQKRQLSCLAVYSKQEYDQGSARGSESTERAAKRRAVRRSRHTYSKACPRRPYRLERKCACMVLCAHLAASCAEYARAGANVRRAASKGRRAITGEVKHAIYDPSLVTKAQKVRAAGCMHVVHAHLSQMESFCAFAS